MVKLFIGFISLGLFFSFFCLAFFGQKAVDLAGLPQSSYVGGPCQYAQEEGFCLITSVTKTEQSLAQAEIKGGPGYQGSLVSFNFYLDLKGELNAQDFGQGPHSLLLGNSWYPGDKFLEKYAIYPGAVFACQKLTITKGTCTPLIFEFPAINIYDYFE